MNDARTTIGEIAFSPGGERWVEFGPPGKRRRVGFHDYAAIYSVPGLYEAIFVERLGMRSTAEVVRLFGDVLHAEGTDPGSQTVVDFGAGSGLGGRALRELGVARLIGIDIEPQARVAAERDHPGVYERYLVGDLGAWTGEEIERLAELRPTALLALSAVGVGHVPPSTLERALTILPAGAIYGFAVAPQLMPGSADPAGRASGYPELIGRLLDRTEPLAQSEYVHRRRADGSDDGAVALIGRKAGPGAIGTTPEG